MRAIDADRLYDQVEARYRQSSGEEHRAERSLLDAICDSPTIDAIPVEWLEESRRDSMNAQWHYAVAIVLSKWQKEQEAHST